MSARMMVLLASVTATATLTLACAKPKQDGIAQNPAPIASDGPPSAIGGGPLSRAKARDEIAYARCQHLVTCGGVAQGKTYDDLDACFVHESAKVDDGLRNDRCVTLDPSRLKTCLSALREKKCDAFFTSWPDGCERKVLCN